MMQTTFLTITFFIAFLGAAVATEFSHFSGGLWLESSRNDCITPEEHIHVEQSIVRFHTQHAFPKLNLVDGPQPYPFYPQAGNLWRDLFIRNFVDIDPSSEFKDWDCTGYSYDSHTGIDGSLRSFAEQEIGVPIFAALDGIVVDVHDGEFDRNISWWDGARGNYSGLQMNR